MRRRMSTSFLSALLGAALALSAAASLPKGAHAQEPTEQLRPTAAELAANHRAFLAMKKEIVWAGAKKHFAEARERAELQRRAKRGDKAAIRALRAKPAPKEEGPPPGDMPRTPTEQAWGVKGNGESPLSSMAIPTNVRVNNPSGDGFGAGQSEESICALGDNVLAAWNDGQGFIVVGNGQGVGYSTNGGASWTDLGNPPAPAGFPSWEWSSDPVVAVDESSGRFFYCGLADPEGALGTLNAIAIAYGHFSGASFVWDASVLVRSAPNSTTFLDKQWIAIDPATHNAYITNTTFTTTGDNIDFYRSTDGGATWSGALQLSSAGDNGFVQGSRVVVGPNGEVHTMWNAVDQITAADNYRYRKSTDLGLNFAAEVTATKYLANFGTGAPGFNRERGIQFAGMAVDRTTGPNRGRVYLSWGEAFNHQDESFTGASRSEVENNNFASRANAFTLPATLRGTLATSTDFDWFSISLTAGQSIALWADSLPANIAYRLLVQAPNPDSLNRLSFGGDLQSNTSASQAFLLYTAPVTGTYYVVMRGSTGSPTNRNYRIRVVQANRNIALERGRDQRDVFVTHSDDGATWATPTQVNTDAVGFDGFLPEIAVGSDGLPYVFWYDFRDDTFGSRANEYVSRSLDGGATWQTNSRLTDVTTNFSTAVVNIAPNMGDYQGIGASATRVHMAWADGRGTDVDTYAASIVTDHSIAACQADTSMNANTTGSLGWTLSNPNTFYANDYTVTVSSARNWPGFGTPNVRNVASLGTSLFSLSVTVPDTAAAGTNQICLTMTNAKGTIVKQCCSNVTVVPTVDVEPGGHAAFALQQSTPNPTSGRARIGFSLPQAARVSLKVYDLSGARVRTLVDGERPAGRQSIDWDGRDDAGNVVKAGAYFYKLEGLGRSAQKRLVIVK